MNALIKNIIAIISLSAISVGCDQKITRPVMDRYTVHVTDNTADRRFDIMLISHDNRALCLSKENWPNSVGQFTVEKADVFVKVDGYLLSAKSKLSSAYCPGDCGEHRIEQGKTLQGFIGYEAFGDSNKLAVGSSKELTFLVQPYYCK